MTKQERHLWYDFLRMHKVKWTRQKLIGNYIADFFSPSMMLVIELDGNQHATEQALAYDAKRSQYFNSLGIKVLRYTNRDIDCNFESVCQEIENTIKCQ